VLSAGTCKFGIKPSPLATTEGVNDAVGKGFPGWVGLAVGGVAEVEGGVAVSRGEQAKEITATAIKKIAGTNLIKYFK